MTDQNEREWPSFGDILEELNSLGGLTQPAHPSSADAAVPSAPPEAPSPFEISELQFGTTTPDEPTPDETSLPAPESDAVPPSTTLDDADSTGSGPDGIDWGNWDFGGTESTDGTLSQTFSPPAAAAASADEHSAVVFEFDTSLLEQEQDDDSDPSVDDLPFDSVATANEIETDLHELFSFVEVDDTADDADQASQIEAPAEASELAGLASLEELSTDDATAVDAGAAARAGIEEPGPDAEDGLADERNDDDDSDNVVPLHRPADNSEHVMGLDDLFDPARPQPVADRAAAEFVSVADDTAGANDSWEYLRPDEEDVEKGGLWSRRPKFFGGDERRAKRAERKKAEEEAELQGPPCPKCGAAGHVDLDDPIGGKIHCSCRSCDHVWSELSSSAQESA